MQHKISFADLPWEGAGGSRSKTWVAGNRRYRLLELTPALDHPDWCVVGHQGYVVEGEFELRFENGVERLSPGDAFDVPSGEGHKHTPRALSDRVVLFVLDEASGLALAPVR
jgi:Cupin domain